MPQKPQRQRSMLLVWVVVIALIVVVAVVLNFSVYAAGLIVIGAAVFYFWGWARD